MFLYELLIILCFSAFSSCFYIYNNYANNRVIIYHRHILLCENKKDNTMYNDTNIPDNNRTMKSDSALIPKKDISRHKPIWEHRPDYF